MGCELTYLTEPVGKWEDRFLAIARQVASWSKDPSTKCGAVIVDPENRIVSLGYNGLARRVIDRPEWLNNRDVKYRVTLHAELNAVLTANRSVEGCTLYTWPFLTCAQCAAVVIQVGIAHVVAPYSENERWLNEFRLACRQYEDAKTAVSVVGTPEAVIKQWLEVGRIYPDALELGAEQGTCCVPRS